MINKSILKLILDSNGWIGFDDFMFLALYDSKFGYYTKSITDAGRSPFGKKGDFITIPMMGPWLGLSLSKTFINLKKNCPHYLSEKLRITELGGGTGHLAAQILTDLNEKNCLPQKYEFIEINTSMIELQKQTIISILKEKSVKDINKIMKILSWRNVCITKKNFTSYNYGEPISGLIIANEVVDAFPVRVFKFIPPKKKGVRPEIKECVVTFDKNTNLIWSEVSADKKLVEHVNCRYIKAKKDGVEWIETRFGEWCQLIPDWCKNVQRKIKWGEIVIIDYGMERVELDQSMRLQSTVTAFRNHTQLNDLYDCLQNPGFQDLTSQVNFTALAENFSLNKNSEVLLKSQASWLLDLGILDEAKRLIFNDKMNEEKYRLLSSLQNTMNDTAISESFLVLKVSKFN